MNNKINKIIELLKKTYSEDHEDHLDDLDGHCAGQTDDAYYLGERDGWIDGQKAMAEVIAGILEVDLLAGEEDS